MAQGNERGVTMLPCICLAVLAVAASPHPVLPTGVTVRMATAMCPMSAPRVGASGSSRSPALIVSRAAFTSSQVRRTVAQWCGADTGDVFVGTTVNLMSNIATIPTLLTPGGDGVAIGIDERHGRLRLGICTLSCDSVVSYRQTPWLDPDDLVSTTFAVGDTQQVLLLSTWRLAMDPLSRWMAASERESVVGWQKDLARISKAPGLMLRVQDHPPREAQRILIKRLFK